MNHYTMDSYTFTKLRLCLMLVILISQVTQCIILSKFYEALGEGERLDRRMLLRTMVYDQDNNCLYIGAVNRVYALSIDNLEEISDSYKSSMDMTKSQECSDSGSSEHCVEVSDPHDYIQLLVPRDKILVVCGTARNGQCIKLHSNALKETTNPLGLNLVSTDRMSFSFTIFGSGIFSDNFIVATSTKQKRDEIVESNEPPPHEPLSPQFHFISNLNSPAMSVHTFTVKAHLKDKLSIDFKGAFTHSGAIYFFSNRTGNSMFVTRMCLNSPETLVEYVVRCSYTHTDDVDKIRSTSPVVEEFTELMQVKFLPPLDSEENGANTDGYVYAAVSGGKGQFTSAICIYKMSDIVEKVIEAVTSNNNVPTYTASYKHINQVKSPKDEIKKSYCTNLGSMSPLSSPTTIVHPVLVLPIKLETISSVAVKRDEDVVVYAGTTSGKILKSKVGSTPQPIVELDIGNQSNAIKDMIVWTREELFALTKKEVIKVKTFDCKRIMACNQCVADAHCGWCMSTRACVDLPVSCTVAQHFLSDTCVDFTVTPEHIYTKTSVDSKFSFNLTRPPSNYDRATCLLGSSTLQSTDTLSFPLTVTDNNKFVCPIYISKTWLFPTAVTFLFLRLDFDGTIWVNKTIQLINCPLAASCEACTRLSCVWNITSMQCLEKTPTSLGGQSSITSEGQCPRMRWGPPQVHRLDFPSGFPVEVRIAMDNFPKTYKELKCTFEDPLIGTTVQANILNTSGVYTVVCPHVVLSYKEAMPYKTTTIHLEAESLNKRGVISSHPIRVYKCRYRAMNCGQCQSIDASDKCVWCDDACEFRDSCRKIQSMPPQAAPQHICTGINATMVSPLVGPTSGNTVLTITGRNFGTNPDELTIRVSNVSCKVQKIVSTDEVHCKTSRGSGKGPAILTLRHNYKVSSLQSYQYLDPVIIKMTPDKGFVSGGALVTLVGINFESGNNFIVALNRKQLPIISRNSREIVFQTLPVTQKMPVTFNFSVDGLSLPYRHTFNFLDDPLLETIERSFSLINGGTLVLFKGKMFDLLEKVQIIVYLPDGTNRTGQLCNNSRESRMTCSTPDLVDTNILGSSSEVKLHFGLLARNQRNLSCLSSLGNMGTPFKMLTYHKPPDIYQVAETYKVTSTLKSVQHVDVRSSDDNLLKRFKEVHIVVGGLEVKEPVPNNPLRFELPHYHDLDGNGRGSVDIVLKVGNFKKSFGRVVLSKPSNTALLVGIVVGLILGFLAVIIITYFIFRCYKMKHKSKYRGPVDYNMDNCNVSIPNLREVSTRKDPKAINPYAQTVPGSSETIPLCRPLDDEHYFQNIIKRIDTLPEEGSDIYIPMDTLKLGDLIGKGNFGSVYLATVLGPADVTVATVAVKTIDDLEMNEKGIENFVREGLMMKRFDHPNVLGLYGLCMGYKKEPYVVLPYMVNGDLRSYVKHSKRQFTARELLQLTHQVSQGMSYLSSINFIHRDLAARNCMIDEHQVVKVADFGLSHDLHEKNYYSSKDQKAKLPIKWMALESLESFIFTIKSDVWSFGVLMWEVMTRGVTPYADVEIFETRNYLASGRRLRRPKYCPENVYNIMLKCWEENSHNRPAFIDLVHEIELTLNPPQRSSSPDLNYLNVVDLNEQAKDVNYLKPALS